MAKTKYKGLTVEINGNVTKLKKAMGELRAEGTVLRSHLGSLSKLIEFNPASTELLAQKQRLLGTAIAQNAQQMEAMRRAEAAYHAQAGPHSLAEQAEYRNLQRRMTQIQLEYEHLKKDAIEFGAAASTGMLTARGKMQSFQRSLSAVSNQFLALGAATGIVGALSLKAAVSFEQAFADVRKTIIATDDEYEQLAYDIRQMALIKPISAEDLAYIESLGGQLNVAKQYLTDFTGVIADLDIATDMNLEDASLQLARFMNIAGMSQQDVDRLGATIVDLGNNSATTESQIMLMAMRIVGSASNIGMSAPNVLALATALSSVGIQAEMGGNAISTIMNRIDKDVALNSSTLSVWAETAGMSAQEFSSLWQNDVTNALTAVVKGMGTFRDEGNNLNLLLKDMGINYMRQIDTMQRLSRTGDILTDAFTRSDTAWEQNVALTREASQRYETAESKMQMMKNALNETGIVIGNEILPYFKKLVVGVTDAIQGFAKMDEGTKQFIITMGGIVTIGSLGVKGLELFAGGGAKVFSALMSMKTAMAFYIAEQTVGTGVTAAHTAATYTNTVAEEANVVARRANVAATAEEAATQGMVTVAKNAATIASGRLAAALGIESALALGLVGVVGVAAVAALVAFAAATADAIDDTDELTETSRKNKQALTEAQFEYERIKFQFGETSNEALAAKAALDEQTAAFEASKETVGEFCDRMEETVDAHEGLMGTIAETSGEANSAAGSILHLAAQYAELASIEERDDQQKAKLASITETLNQQVDGLGLSYDAATDSVNMSADAVQALAEKEVQRLKAEASMENLNGLYAEQSQLELDLVEAQAELEAETQRNIDAYGMMGDTQVWVSFAQADLQRSVDDLTEAYAENQERVELQSQILAAMKSKELALKYAADELAAGTMNAADAAAEMSERFGVSITDAEVLAERESRVAEQVQQEAVDVSELVSKLEELEEENGALVVAIAESGMSLEDFAHKMLDAGIKAEDLAKGVQEMSDKTTDAFNKIEYESDLSLNSMIETLEHNISVTESWGDNMKALYEKAGEGGKGFVQYIAKLGPEYAPIVEQLVNDTDGKLEYLIELYGNAGNAGPVAFLKGMGMLSGEVAQVMGITEQEAQAAFDQIEAAAAETGENVPQAMAEGIQNGTSPEEAMASVVQSVGDVAGGLPDAMRQVMVGSGSEIADGVYAQQDAAAAAADTLSKLVADHFSSASGDAWWAGNNMAAVSFRDGIDAGRGAAVASADTASKHVADHFSAFSGDAWWAGYNMALGAANGIDAGRSLMVDAARRAMRDANNAAKDEAGIHSPSAVWHGYGYRMPEGGAGGILKAASLMESAASKAMRLANASAERSLRDSYLLNPDGMSAAFGLVDNASQIPSSVLALASYPVDGFEMSGSSTRKRGSISGKGFGGAVYNEWNISSNNPEEVAALVENRERRSGW